MTNSMIVYYCFGESYFMLQGQTRFIMIWKWTIVGYLIYQLDSKMSANGEGVDMEPMHSHGHAESVIFCGLPIF